MLPTLQVGEIDPKNGLKIGSPEWRDAQDNEFDSLIEDPNTWQFTVTPDQKKVIASAYKAYQDEFGQDKIPDLQTVRLMVINVIPENDDGQTENQSPEAVVSRTSGIKFWEDFNSDMPEVFRRRGSMHVELNIAWQDYKIKAILKGLSFKYMDWETKELVMNIKSPGSLRRAAAEMEKLEAQGFALYNTEFKDFKDGLIEYYFRKGKVIES